MQWTASGIFGIFHLQPRLERWLQGRERSTGRRGRPEAAAFRGANKSRPFPDLCRLIPPSTVSSHAELDFHRPST